MSNTGPCNRCGANDRTPGGSCRICTRYAAEKRKANAKPGEYAAEMRLRSRKSYWKQSEAARKARARRRICRRYGMTVEAYDAMLQAQGGACKICRCTTPPKGKSFHVDHCHRTGKVRGILCHHCNVAIGLIREDVRIAKSIVDYLELHRCKAKAA